MDFITILKWELATWLLGTTALAAIITLLILYRNKPVKDWPVGFSLATTIAALSQVAQSALLVSVSSCIGQLKWSYLRNERSTLDINKFEEASRGPRGSLMLLLNTRPHLVSVGAIATILLLGFSPFSQQSVTIEVRSTNGTFSPTSAIIGRSVQYVNDAANASFVEYEMDSQSTSSVMYHPHMSKGILTGILDDISSPSDVTGSCQAEFCTWEPYQTLAVCSFVDDVSAEGAMYDPVYVLGPDSPNGSPMYSVGPESWSRDQMGVNISETFWMNTQVDWQEPDSRAEGHEPLRNISTTYVAYYPPCDHDGNPRTDWVGQRDDAANWKGFRGSLILCLQTLNSTYNSTMQTKVIDTQIDLDWQIKPGVTNNSQYRYCVTGRGNEEYCVGDTDITEWEYQMATSLTGAAAIYPNEANYTFSGQLAPNIVIDVLGDSPAYCNGSNVEGGFERRMNNIAISMSNALRTGNNAVPFRGTGWTKEQFFDVTFYWMSLPLAIYLTITLFLFSTIVTSSKADTPLWKSSPLVLLEAMNSSNRMQSLIQVESEARGTAIKLQHTGGNWHLQTMPVSSENKVQIA